MSTWTKGPWMLGATVDSSTYHIEAQEGTIAIVFPSDRSPRIPGVQRVPDVCLIALAPEMAEALQRLIFASDDCKGHKDCAHGMEPWQTARAILARLND